MAGEFELIERITAGLVAGDDVVLSVGDDLRRIDWRVYGRTDRFYLKTYEADTNADVMLVLDSSGSMDFASGRLTKFDYARYLTASLAWLGAVEGVRPDRWDLIGAGLCLLGAAVILLGPRPA